MHARRASFLVALLLPTLCACAPFVQHGPWVRSGTSGGFIATGSFMDRDFLEAGDRGAWIGIDGAVRGGYLPADSTATAFSAGVQMSMWALLVAGSLDSPADALQLLSTDMYATLPRSAKLASSVGATGSFHHIMPYFQIGSRSPQNGGWYTTQAFLITNLVDTDLGTSGTFLWLPSWTQVTADARPRATHFTLGGGVGRSGGRTMLIFTLGAGMEFFRRDTRTR